MTVHLAYVDKYGADIVDFIVEKDKEFRSRGFKYRVENDSL